MLAVKKKEDKRLIIKKKLFSVLIEFRCCWVGEWLLEKSAQKKSCTEWRLQKVKLRVEAIEWSYSLAGEEKRGQTNWLIAVLYWFFVNCFKQRKLSTRHSHNNSNPSDVEKLHTKKKYTRGKTGKSTFEYTFHRVFLLCYYIAFFLGLCVRCCLLEMAFDINHMYRAITIIVLSSAGVMLLCSLCFVFHYTTHNKL